MRVKFRPSEVSRARSGGCYQQVRSPDCAGEALLRGQRQELTWWIVEDRAASPRRSRRRAVQLPCAPGGRSRRAAVRAAIEMRALDRVSVWAMPTRRQRQSPPRGDWYGAFQKEVSSEGDGNSGQRSEAPAKRADTPVARGRASFGRIMTARTPTQPPNAASQNYRPIRSRG